MLGNLIAPQSHERYQSVGKQLLFQNFNFALLDDPAFLEDSVREELVVPLLAALGYSASLPHRIIRSLHLQHPYVYIGTVKKPVTIVPDYVLQRDGKNAWILDAKAPSEVIDSGKHVEQAYSYAIHKEVRVPIYALCNGSRLTVFHVSEWPAILDLPLQDIDAVWPMVLDLLGTSAAWPEGLHPGFLPDFGLALRKAGLDRDEHGQKYFQIFESVPLRYLAKVEDDLYSLTAPYRQEAAPGEFTVSMVTFDFNAERYQSLLAALPNNFRDRAQRALFRQPYRIFFEDEEVPLLTIVAEAGDAVHKNKNESYCPFIAKELVVQ